MRWRSIGLACVMLAGCSKSPDSPRDEVRTYDVEAAPDGGRATAPAPPSINVTAAPGVAFTYAYSFRLPAERVATVQEQHAQACEKLGIARCRITGMRYQLLGEHNVSAQLEFKLAPDIARAFGRNGIAAVEQAKGSLTDARIAGVDAGGTLDRLAVARERTASEQRRLDAELAKGGRSASERAELQRQRADLAQQLAANADNAADQRASLATTPLTFSYDSGPAIRGFDASAPVKSSVDLLLGSAQFTLTFVLGALALLLPPGLVLLLGWLVWRRVRRARRDAPAA